MCPDWQLPCVAAAPCVAVPAVQRQLVMAYWNALLAAVVKVALCQAGSSVHGRHGSWLLLPQPLQMHHAVLLQQLLAVVQTQVSEMMLAGQQQNAAAALATSTVAGIAAAAVHARSVLQMLLLPTAQLTQRFVQAQNTAQPMQQPTQLDILRCLRQRACDLEAQLFVQQQLHKAGGSIMQLLFGLSAAEAVQVYAACSTTAGSAAGIGAGNKPLLAVLGSSSSSSSGVPGAVSGCIYLSNNYLAFTDLLVDCGSTSSSADADAIAKRVAKAVKQAQAGAMKAGLPATAPPPPPPPPSASANPAAARATGSSSSSSGLATKSWWKSSLLPPSGGSGSSSGSSATAQPQSSASAPATAPAAAAAAAAQAADTTLLMPLADVARLDKVYHKGHDALALTMQPDRSLRVFYGFECAAVRDKLHDAVRLAAMGSNTALDRNLRCCKETVGES